MNNPSTVQILCSWQFALLSGMCFGVLLYLNLFAMHVHDDYARPIRRAYIPVPPVGKVELPPMATRTASTTSTVRTTTVPLPARCEEFNVPFHGLKADLPVAEPCPRWDKWTTTLKNCLKRELEKSEEVWAKLHEAVGCCLREFHKLMPLLAMGAGKEQSYVITPWEVSDSCRVVTVAKSADFGAKRRLKAMLPQCEFYATGLQTGYESSSDKFGDFWNTPVGAKTGPATIWKKAENCSYTQMRVNLIAFAGFL